MGEEILAVIKFLSTCWSLGKSAYAILSFYFSGLPEAVPKDVAPAEVEQGVKDVITGDRSPVTVINFNGPVIIGKLDGETLKAVRKIFQTRHS